MKRKSLSLLLTALLLSTVLSGCGAQTKMMGGAFDSFAATSAAAPLENGAKYESYDMDYDSAPELYMEDEHNYAGAFKTVASDSSNGEAAELRADMQDKIIYSGSARVETIRFDETIDQVYGLIERFGGFLESSYVTGRDYYSQYYDHYGYRNASFVIRVPRECFSDLRSSLTELGSVTESSVQAQNITSAYRDTESRLNTYRTEEERLLDMLKKANTVDEMLQIESRLSDVRYQIESLSTTLLNWDSKVNYSTLSLNISEVRELTEEKPIPRSFGDDILEGVQDSLRWLEGAVKDIVVFLLSAIPLLILPVIVVVALILLIRAKRKKSIKKATPEIRNDVKDDN